MFVKALHSIGYAGELHPPGAVLEIPDEEIQRLLYLGAVEHVADAETPSKKAKR